MGTMESMRVTDAETSDKIKATHQADEDEVGRCFFLAEDFWSCEVWKEAKTWLSAQMLHRLQEEGGVNHNGEDGRYLRQQYTRDDQLFAELPNKKGKVSGHAMYSLGWGWIIW